MLSSSWRRTPLQSKVLKSPKKILGQILSVLEVDGFWPEYLVPVTSLRQESLQEITKLKQLTDVEYLKVEQFSSNVRRWIFKKPPVGMEWNQNLFLMVIWTWQIYANVPGPVSFRLPIFCEASKEHCRFQSTPSFRLQQFARIPWQISPWHTALSRSLWWFKNETSYGCWNLQWTKHVFTSWYFNILTIVLESSWFIKHDHGHHFFCPGTLLPCWMGWRPQTQNLALPLKIIAPHTPRDPGTSNSLDQAWPAAISHMSRKHGHMGVSVSRCQSENMKNHNLYDTLDFIPKNAFPLVSLGRCWCWSYFNSNAKNKKG